MLPKSAMLEKVSCKYSSWLINVSSGTATRKLGMYPVLSRLYISYGIHRRNVTMYMPIKYFMSNCYFTTRRENTVPGNQDKI